MFHDGSHVINISLQREIPDIAIGAGSLGFFVQRKPFLNWILVAFMKFSENE